MSYCGACSKCVREKELVEQPSTVNLVPHSGQPAGKKKKKDELEELEELLTEMRSIRNDARRLTRSGNPAVSAQALSQMAQAEDNIRWLHARMVEEARDA